MTEFVEPTADWKEPIYPITKTEHFDDEIMRELVKDERFAKQDSSSLVMFPYRVRTYLSICIDFK